MAREGGASPAERLGEGAMGDGDCARTAYACTKTRINGTTKICRGMRQCCVLADTLFLMFAALSRALRPVHHLRRSIAGRMSQPAVASPRIEIGPHRTWIVLRQHRLCL